MCNQVKQQFHSTLKARYKANNQYKSHYIRNVDTANIPIISDPIPPEILGCGGKCDENGRPIPDGLFRIGARRGFSESEVIALIKNQQGGEG